MTDRRSRLTAARSISRFLIPLILMGTLFAGCEQFQELLTPLPPDDGESAVKIGFLYTSPNRNNSRYGAELAALQLNESGGVRGTPIQLVPRDIPTQRLVSEDINDTEYVAALAEELISVEGVSAIVGPNRSTYAVVVGEIAQRRRIPMNGNLRDQSGGYGSGGLCVHGGFHGRLSKER